ncbi:MAG TPA: hypothetical protein VHD31_03440 [Candidatus Paceibacterota bacterium]|nr:hypothetical protein [Candidatus Paceibacterota bacterium]
MKLLKKTFQVSTASLLAWTVAGIASAQTTATTTPGVPNTGAGGDTILNLVILAIAAVVVAAGVAFLSSRWAQV